MPTHTFITHSSQLYDFLAVEYLLSQFGLSWQTLDTFDAKT